MNKENYDDIINLPHHVSPVHPHISVQDRAAQFSPFSALTGYDDAVQETARLTDERIELDEYEKEALNEKLVKLKENLPNHPQICVTYFVKDNRKSGGEYVTRCVTVRKIDEFEKKLVTDENVEISLEDVVALS